VTFKVCGDYEDKIRYMPAHVKFVQPEINTSSVADIAFLLLSFFLMTTVIRDDKGLLINLAPWQDQPEPVQVQERNVLRLHLNSANRLMIEGQENVGYKDIQMHIRRFVLNHGRDVKSSESPEKAIISLRADRGASHAAFIGVLDEIQAFYHTEYASRAGMSVAGFLSLDPSKKEDKIIIERAKLRLPMNISIVDER